MKILFVVNPVSGGEDKDPFLNWAEDECRRYGWDFQVFLTTGDKDLAALKSLINEFCPTRVASVGGDGTTLLTAQAIMHTGIPMGLIPLGSANGMATELGVDTDPKLAFRDFVLSEEMAALDLIKVNNEHYCLHIGDVGINAQIVRSYAQDGTRGLFTYAKYLFSELSHSSPFLAQVTTEDRSFEVEGVMIAIANSRKYGTGVVLNRFGTPFDGKFEIVVVKDVNFDTLLKSGLALISESFADENNSQVISCTSATIRLQKPTVLQLDGEIIGEFKEIQAEVVPACVRVVMQTQATNLT